MVHANYETGVSSLFYQDFAFDQVADSSNAFDVSGIDSITDSDSDAISSTSDFDFSTVRSDSTPSVTLKGCATILEDEVTVPTSASLCSGLALDEEPGAPSIDSTGKFSAKWALTTMKSKMKTAE